MNSKSIIIVALIPCFLITLTSCSSKQNYKQLSNQYQRCSRDRTICTSKLKDANDTIYHLRYEIDEKNKNAAVAKHTINNLRMDINSLNKKNSGSNTELQKTQKVLLEKKKELKRLKNILKEIDQNVKTSNLLMMNKNQLKAEIRNVKKKLKRYELYLSPEKKDKSIKGMFKGWFSADKEDDIPIDWDPEFLKLKIKESKKELKCLGYALVLQQHYSTNLSQLLQSKNI